MPELPHVNGMTVLVLLGNKTAELAKGVLAAIKDHVTEPYCSAMRCISFVDKDVDQKWIVEDDVFFPYQDDAGAMAFTVYDKVIRCIRDDFGNRGIDGVNLTKMNCVIVADASAPNVSLKMAADVAREVNKVAGYYSIYSTGILCIIAHQDMNVRAFQNGWLVDDTKGKDSIRPELDSFSKVLLLSDAKDNGIGSAERNKMDMQDALLPSLLRILDANEFNEGNRLYTASYGKEGATSQEMKELKQHIGADILEGYFGNDKALSEDEFWKTISTDTLSFDAPGGVLKKVNNAADMLRPTLSAVVASADLEDKDFDEADCLLRFEDMNRDRMLNIEELMRTWLNEVVAKLQKVNFPDAFAKMLDEDGPLVHDLLKEWNTLNNRKAELVSSDYVARNLLHYPNGKKLLQSLTDYNLAKLNYALENYQRICTDRLAMGILYWITQFRDTLRMALQKKIDFRHTELGRYRMDSQRLRALSQSCGSAEEELRGSFAREKIDQLSSYLENQDSLYEEEKRRTKATVWKMILDQLAGRHRMTSFSDAVLSGQDNATQNRLQEMSGKAPALIPQFPEDENRICVNGAYLINERIYDKVFTQDNQMGGSAVYAIPGDLLEYVGLFPMGNNWQTLMKLKLFNLPEGERPRYASAEPVRRRQEKKAAAETDDFSVENRNPWNITVKAKEGRIRVNWDYPATDMSTDISINDMLFVEGFTKAQYEADGYGCDIEDKGQIPPGMLKITLGCGEEKYSVYYQSLPTDPLLLDRSKTVARLKLPTGSADDYIRCGYDCDTGKWNCVLVQNALKPGIEYRLPMLTDKNMQGFLWEKDGESLYFRLGTYQAD